MTSLQRTLTGRIRVGLPPGEAFRLFTPRGEQEWAHGWHPQFPAPAPDDTQPGTVFETDAHGGRTIWLVVDRQPGKRISYARVTPGDLAGTVTVALRAAGRNSEVEVTYQLTALTGAPGDKLREFADGYPDYLESWQDAIAAWLRRERPSVTATSPEGPRSRSGNHGKNVGIGQYGPPALRSWRERDPGPAVRNGSCAYRAGRIRYHRIPGVMARGAPYQCHGARRSTRGNRVAAVP